MDIERGIKVNNGVFMRSADEGILVVIGAYLSVLVDSPEANSRMNDGMKMPELL